MLTPDQEKLKEAAQAAVESETKVIHKRQRARYEFHAAITPAAILAILAQLEQVQGDADRYRWLMREMPCNIADLFDGPINFDEVDDEIDEQIALAKSTLPPPPEAACPTSKS